MSFQVGAHLFCIQQSKVGHVARPCYFRLCPSGRPNHNCAEMPARNADFSFATEKTDGLGRKSFARSLRFLEHSRQRVGHRFNAFAKCIGWNDQWRTDLQRRSIDLKEHHTRLDGLPCPVAG